MDWTTEELSASVDVYVEMLEFERRGDPFVKKRYYQNLSSKFGRSPGAFERRMQNISHVYALLGRRWLTGLKPLKNVGSNVLPLLEELILEKDPGSPDPQMQFDLQVARLIEGDNLPKPSGKSVPEKFSKEVFSHQRDPAVVAWVLKNSRGYCEACEQPAPFVKPNGQLFLEVHHLRRLADGGSDTTGNAIAVCPNCHRELHSGIEKEKLRDSVYRRLVRLQRE